MALTHISVAQLPIENGVGVVGYKVMDENGAQVVARTTAGVVRIFQGVGFSIYQIKLLPSVSKGTVVWDDAAGNPKHDMFNLDFGPSMDAQGYTSARSESLQNILRASRAIVEGTAAVASTVSVIAWTAINVPAVALNEFRGLILKFPIDTPTAALRGQAAEIISNTTSLISVSPAFTVAPSQGGNVDLFVIE